MKTQSRVVPPTTDWLITDRNEQGKHFDYAIKSWIKGLADYPDVKMPDDMVESSLAFFYLHDAERLLKEKSPRFNDDLKTINDLKSLIRKVDYHKIFLLTLRIAISTCKAGFIPGLVQQGVNFSETQRDRLPKKRTVKGFTPEMREDRNGKIIEHFRKTHLTPAHFAQKYARKYGIKPRTVRYVLSKAVGI